MFLEMLRQPNQSHGLLFYTIVLSLFAFAIYIQSQIYIHWDINQLLHDTRLLLAGGNYVDDFYVPSTPLTLYLYTPPVLISQWFHLELSFVFKTYVILLACLSSYLSLIISRI